MGFSKYPGEVDDHTTLPVSTDLVTPVRAEVVNRLRDAVIATQTELGSSPSGVFGTVKARLDEIESSIATIAATSSGDVSDLLAELNALKALTNALIANISNPHSVNAAQVGAPDILGSSTDEAIMRFNGTLGQMQNSPSGPYVRDSGQLDLINNVSVSGEISAGGTFANLAKINATDVVEIGGTNVSAVQLRSNAGLALQASNTLVSTTGYIEANTSAGSLPSTGSIRIPSGSSNGIYSLWGVDAVNLASVTAGIAIFGSQADSLATVIDSSSAGYVLVRNGNNGSVRITTSGMQFENEITATINVETSTSGAGNNLSLIGGAAFVTGGGAGGDVVVKPGLGDGAGVDGQIDLQDADSNTIATVDAEGLGLTERSGNPTPTANKGFLFPKDDAGITELFYQDSTGFVSQVTRDGSITNFLNVRDFGAVTDVLGGGNAIQDAIDAMLNDVDKYTGIYIPPGLYSITQPLIIAKSSAFIKVVMMSSGRYALNAAGFGGTIIKLEGDGYQDLPVLIVQGGRSCYFEGITFLNTGNTAPFDNIGITDGLYQFPDLTDWISPGVRTNAYSPHCVVAIDPFVDGYPQLDINNAYPGLEDYYGGPLLATPLASSNTTFKNCTFYGGYVGVASSPPGGPTPTLHNNENNLYQDCYWSYNTYHYASGQSQERNTNIRAAKMFGSWCCITTEVVGLGGNYGNCPFIFGASFGGTRYIFDINAFVRTFISNVHIESTVSFGKLGVALSSVQGGVHIDGVTCSFYTPAGVSSPTLQDVPFHFHTWGMVSLKNFTCSNNNGADNFIRFWNSSGRLELDNFHVAIIPGQDNAHVPIAFHDLTGVRGTPWQSYNAVLASVYHDDPTADISVLDLSGNPTVQVIVDPSDSSEGTISLASTAGLEVGDILRIASDSPNTFAPQVISTTELAYTYQGPVGMISSIDIDTSISVSHLPYQFPFSTNLKLERVRMINYEISTSTFPGLVFNMDALYDVQDADGTDAVNGELVASWISADAVSRILTQTTTSLRPTYESDVLAFNHQPGVLFSVDGYYVEYTGGKTVTNFLHNGVGATATICFSYDSLSPGTLLSTLSDSASNIGLEIAVDGYGSVITKVGNGTGTYLVDSTSAAATLVDGYAYVVTVRHSTAASPQFDIRVNSVSVDSGSYNGTASGSASTDDLTIGSETGGVNGFGSHMFAVLLSSSNLIDAYVSNAETRLLNRIGQ